MHTANSILGALGSRVASSAKKDSLRCRRIERRIKGLGMTP